MVVQSFRLLKAEDEIGSDKLQQLGNMEQNVNKNVEGLETRVKAG